MKEYLAADDLRGILLLPWPSRLAGAAVAVLFLLALSGDVDGLHRRLDGQRLAGDREAAFGVGAHLVQGGLVRALDGLAVGAGPGARVDLRCACRDRAIGGGAHLVQRRLAGAAAGDGGALGVGWLHRLVLALDAAAGVRPCGSNPRNTTLSVLQWGQTRRV